MPRAIPTMVDGPAEHQRAMTMGAGLVAAQKVTITEAAGEVVVEVQAAADNKMAAAAAEDDPEVCSLQLL